MKIKNFIDSKNFRLVRIETLKVVFKTPYLGNRWYYYFIKPEFHLLLF